MDEQNINGMEPENEENNAAGSMENTSSANAAGTVSSESYSAGTVEPPQNAGDKKGMAIASMVLGIIAVVFFCMWYIAIPAAIVGLVLGILSNKAAKSGMATAGIVLSIIALAVAIIWLLGLGALIAGLSAMS